MAVASLLIFGYLVSSAVRVANALNSGNGTCDTPAVGFQCQPAISHSWGQYSPFFSVNSEIDSSIPDGCEITFAQLLSRHGARDPTSNKSKAYAATVERIHAAVTSYGPGFEFVRDYNYTLGVDQLTDFGRQQMANSGIKFYERYQALTRSAGNAPFIRSAGQQRVVESAMNWTMGFHQARLAAGDADGEGAGSPYGMVVIPEDEGVNNTLAHSLCTAFEHSTDGDEAMAEFLPTFIGPIVARLNAGLQGVNLSAAEAVVVMELCPFNTVADDGGALSPFCALFAEDEWESYGYLQTLGKYYGYGDGNPLGSTQGVGFVNELVSRLTGKTVEDRTTTNSTLDSDPATFPLDRRLYADFSHDNDMAGVYAALGLYNATGPLSRTARTPARDAAGYSASWAVPFAARMYVEKMTCSPSAASPFSNAAGDGAQGQGQREELVRILVNDRVVPLQGCGADALGRCTLGRFVDSLSFARAGGRWNECFV